MKMANIDAVFDFMFTDPKTKEGVSATPFCIIVTKLEIFNNSLAFSL